MIFASFNKSSFKTPSYWNAHEKSLEGNDWNYVTTRWYLCMERDAFTVTEFSRTIIEITTWTCISWISIFKIQFSWPELVFMNTVQHQTNRSIRQYVHKQIRTKFTRCTESLELQWWLSSNAAPQIVFQFYILLCCTWQLKIDRRELYTRRFHNTFSSSGPFSDRIFFSLLPHTPWNWTKTHSDGYDSHW